MKSSVRHKPSQKRSTVALGEFAEGFAAVSHPVLATVRRSFVVVDIDADTALSYGQIARSLRRSGHCRPQGRAWVPPASGSRPVGCYFWLGYAGGAGQPAAG